MDIDRRHDGDVWGYPLNVWTSQRPADAAKLTRRFFIEQHHNAETTLTHVVIITPRGWR